MKKAPDVETTEAFPPPQPPRKEQAMTDSTAFTQQQRAPHLPSIPGMAVDLFDTASLAVTMLAAFAIKYVTAAVTQ